MSVYDYDPFGVLPPDLFRPVLHPDPEILFPLRVISGGQTGADTGGLIAAARHAIATGGMAPKGWLREDPKGKERTDEAFLRAWGLTECLRPGYPARNVSNIVQADKTVLFFCGMMTSGTTLTRNQLVDLGKRPEKDFRLYDVNDLPNPIGLAAWIHAKEVHTLNVAGTRETRAPGITRAVDRFLDGVFRILREARRWEVVQDAGQA